MSTPSASAPAPGALPDPSAWGAALAVRLRYLQASLAEETAEARQAHLEDEVRRALQEVPPSRRGEYLAAVQERFPTWAGTTVVVGGSTTAAAVPVAPTTDETIEQFFALLPRLEPEKRERLKARLAEAGFVTTETRTLDPEVLAEVQQKLRLHAQDPVDPSRLGRLFVLFADVFCILDQLAWNVWKNAAPKSGLRRDAGLGDLRALVRKSLAGDAETSATLVQQQVERTRQLIAGLLAAIGPAGRNFARRHLTRYSPEAVRDLLKLEGGSSLFASPDARAWKKYCDLAQEITEASIEADVQEAITRYAEDLMKGSAR